MLLRTLFVVVGVILLVCVFGREKCVISVFLRVSDEISVFEVKLALSIHFIHICLSDDVALRLRLFE